MQAHRQAMNPKGQTVMLKKSWAWCGDRKGMVSGWAVGAIIWVSMYPPGA